MDRTKNVEVFLDTKACYEKMPVLREAVKMATKAQKVILESDELPTQDRERYAEPATVIVSKKRTMEAAAAYTGQRVAVLNFASASNPGGGVVNGASAQEECLCRVSTLYPSLNSAGPWQLFYGPHRAVRNPIHNDDIIYTPGVMVFKADTDEPSLLSEADWYPVDVITCAAPNLNSNAGARYNPGDAGTQVSLNYAEQKAVHEKRLRRILEVALSEDADVVILGAFGCGAFRNDPKAVAEASFSVIGEYAHAFRTIEFAIYCPPGREENYKRFQEAH